MRDHAALWPALWGLPFLERSFRMSGGVVCNDGVISMPHSSPT
jgi:hypothetical protein